MTQTKPTQSAHRILIVEDEATAREALADYLNELGYEVASVGTAAEALDVASDWCPDVLVSDWQLGGGRTGVDVARELQTRHGVRVVLITGKPLERLRDSSTDVDVLSYMKKPISLAGLTHLLENAA